MREFLQETGEAFPNVKVADWNAVKLDAVNKRLATAEGTRINLQRIRVETIREIEAKQNRNYGKWVLDASDRASRDCELLVNAFFSQELADQIKLDTVKAGQLVDLSGVIVKATFYKHRGKWICACGIRVDTATLAKK